MRRYVSLIGFVVCVIIVSLFIWHGTPDIQRYVPFPVGYGYMESLGELEKATDEGKRATIRDHAWKLWAGIMQPAPGWNWPIWYTWPNETGAFQPGNPGTALGELDISQSRSGGLIARNRANALPISDLTPATPICRDSAGNTVTCVNTPNQPFYPIPSHTKEQYWKATYIHNGDATIADGNHFQFNGDILIATESLSREAFNNIRFRKLYLQKTLNTIHKGELPPVDLPQRSIVTKHMYWPVKARGITAIPVWKDNFPSAYTDYVGYEKWNTFVGVDPSNKTVGTLQPVKFLFGVKESDKQKPLGPVIANVQVHGLDEFYYHQITQDDWNSFNDADKAILDAASYWANSQPIEVGDYLITIAMHVNTKELNSWTLQSVWWSDEPKQGQYAEDRPQLPEAKGPWDRYLLTDAYAVPANPDGNLDISFNPYIEGVIHPIGTSCRNCHIRAGWPVADTDKDPTVGASYQNPDCPGLLTALSPESDCLKSRSSTDYLWIIPDRAKLLLLKQ
jgi:hypothetical protein